MSFRVRNSSNQYNTEINDRAVMDIISDKDIMELKEESLHKYKHQTKDIDDYILKLHSNTENSIFEKDNDEVFVFDEINNVWKLIKDSEKDYLEFMKINNEETQNKFPEFPDILEFSEFSDIN